MKIASSLKSLKKRDLGSKLVRRRGRVYIINKKPQIQRDKSNFMDDQTIKVHGIILLNLSSVTIAVVLILVLMAIFLL